MVKRRLDYASVRRILVVLRQRIAHFHFQVLKTVGWAIQQMTFISEYIHRYGTFLRAIVSS